MYERNAIILERYLNKVFGQNKDTSIKAAHNIYQEILEEMEKYQIVTEEEEKVIEEFDDIAKQMQSIQKKQESLYLDTVEREEEREKLFNDFDQEPSIIERKLIKIEKIVLENEKDQQEIREEYIELLKRFVEKQKERNKCSKTRRTAETNHMKVLNETVQQIEAIDLLTVKRVKDFSSMENSNLSQTLNKVMTENGKNEKIKFDADVIKKAAQARIDIAKKEAECYMSAYEKLKRLMTEVEGGSLKLDKYQKVEKDITIKIKFLEAEKDYVVSFLDNERMTSMNGEKVHKEMMQEACKNFDKDIIQIDNLYDLISKEMQGKATKKAYKELYNSTYLQDIEQTEKTFKQEVNTIRANIGTIINTNYWRIEGIKNIYEVFNKEIEEKYERDLSEFMPEEKEEEQPPIEEKPQKPKLKITKEIEEDDDDDDWFISNDEKSKGKDYIDDEDEYDNEDEEDLIFAKKPKNYNQEKSFNKEEDDDWLKYDESTENEDEEEDNEDNFEYFFDSDDEEENEDEIEEDDDENDFIFDSDNEEDDEYYENDEAEEDDEEDDDEYEEYYDDYDDYDDFGVDDDDEEEPETQEQTGKNTRQTRGKATRAKSKKEGKRSKEKNNEEEENEVERIQRNIKREKSKAKSKRMQEENASIFGRIFKEKKK